MIVSYVNKIREELPLDRIDQKADAIFDIFAAHQRDLFDFEIEMPQNPAPFSQPHLLINCKHGRGRNLGIQGYIKSRLSRVVSPKV